MQIKWHFCKGEKRILNEAGGRRRRRRSRSVFARLLENSPSSPLQSSFTRGLTPRCDVTLARRIGAVIRGADSHFFRARLVVPQVRSPTLSLSLSLSLSRGGGGVVNVKTLIVMSCDTGGERREREEKAGRHADRHTAARRPRRDCRFVLKLETKEAV